MAGNFFLFQHFSLAYILQMASSAAARGILVDGFVRAALANFPLVGGFGGAQVWLEACELLPWRAQLWANSGPQVGEIIGGWVAAHGARADRDRWARFLRRRAQESGGGGAWTELWDRVGGGDRLRFEAGVRRLQGAGFSDPRALGQATGHEISLRLGRGWECDDFIWALSDAAATEFGLAGQAPRLPRNAFALAALLAGGSPAETGIGRRKAALEELFGIGAGDAAGVAPRGWQGLLRRGGPSPLLVRRLVEYAAAFNLISSFGRSLPSVASALRSWGGFCDALGLAHFPVTGELARDYARVHREEETYSVYVGHVRKACELLGLDASWARASCVKAAKRGLAAQAVRFKPPREAVSFGLLARLCGIRPAVSEPKLFVIVSWVFMLRAASEGAEVVRAANDSAALDGAAPHATPAALGLVGGKLVLRLQRRKNRPRGDLLSRGCSCGEGGGVSRHCGPVFCPVCVLWPIVRRKFAVGSALFLPGVARRAAEWLRAGLRELGVPRWDRFSLHALRRGAARALVERGGDLADLCRAGSWSSTAALRFYLDMRDVERRALEAGVSSSDEEGA